MSMSPEMGVIKPMALLPFPPDQVGTYSCHGVEPGMRQGETSAKINQDRGCVIYPFGQEACPEFEQALFCVFDGHGACGDKVSQFTAEKVPELLEKHPKLKLNPATALEEAFVTVDRNLKEDATIDAELSGTTAVVVLLRKDAAKGTITAYTANAGDSRAVVATTRRWRQTRCADGRRSARARLSPPRPASAPCASPCGSPPPLCAQSTWTSRRTRSPTRRTR